MLSNQYGTKFKWTHQWDNHGKMVCRLFHILAEFPFTTCGRGIDYYHKRVNVWAASRADKKLKTWDPWKLGNSWNAWNWWKSTQPAIQKLNFGSCATKLRKISSKTFHRKTYVTQLVEFFVQKYFEIFLFVKHFVQGCRWEIFLRIMFKK